MKKGFSLIEMIVGMVLSLLVIGLILVGLRSAQKSTDDVFTKSDLEMSGALAVAQILEVGRLADKCKRNAGGDFECDVDFATPPRSQPLTKVRFILTGEQLLYQKKNGSGAWENAISYPKIQEFLVCDDTMMANPNGCQIGPQALNQAHTTNRNAVTAPVPPNRFYRFRVVQKIEQTKTADVKTFTLQSALYVRNPVPITGPGQVIYQWGHRGS